MVTRRWRGGSFPVCGGSPSHRPYPVRRLIPSGPGLDPDVVGAARLGAVGAGDDEQVTPAVLAGSTVETRADDKDPARFADPADQRPWRARPGAAADRAPVTAKAGAPLEAPFIPCSPPSQPVGTDHTIAGLAGRGHQID